MKKFYYILFMVLPMLAFVGCAEEEFTDTNDNRFVLSYQVQVADDTQSRAVGDGSQADELIVGVFEKDNKGGNVKVKNFSFDRNQEGKFDVAIPLFKNKEYNLVFWAQKKDNGVYNTDDLSNIRIDYGKINGMSLENAVSLDAFSTVQTAVTASTSGGNLTLKRPFTMISTGASGSSLEDVKTAELTLSKVYTSYQPLAGTVGDPQEHVTLSFKDFGEETFTAEEETFYYMTTAFLLVSEEDNDIEVSGEFKDDEGSSISSIEPTTISDLKVNHRTHLGKPLTEGWDGETRVEELTPSETDGIIHIENAAQMVYLLEKGYSSDGEAPQKIHLCKDLDMKGNITRNENYVLKNIEFDGGGFTLYNLPLPLFGESMGLTVKDLTLQKSTVTTGNINGALATTVKGNATFTNVTIDNCNVTATDIAGGIVGYISRVSEKDRSESLAVTFDNCHVKTTTLSASVMGKVVGELSGYDNKEELTFTSTCTVSGMADNSSAYIAANQSVWLDAVDTKYNGWLGNETYRRGVVKFGELQLVPKWDGTTTVEPIVENNVKLIYSPFDLASMQGTNPGSILFMENVDLGTKLFNPLTNISKLTGENKTIYNLKVETTFNTNSWDGGGFIRRCGTSTIENITFNNADVKVTHASGSDGDAYASIVCGTAEGNNTMTNVKVIGGKLYGCNKMGGIAGYISGTFNATNCIVDGLSIENYDSGGKDSFGFKANGEVGGAFGFIAANSTISGCYVKNTTLNCVGVDNGKALYVFKYAGRHVNEFIGDIRTTTGQTIKITYTESNFTNNVYKNRKDQYSKCKYIGHCYYTDIVAIKDTKGTVYVNGSSITVAKNY